MNSSNQNAFEEERPQISAPPENPLCNARRRFSMTLLSYLFILLASSALASLIYLVLQAHFPSLLKHPLFEVALSSLPTYCLVMPLSLLFFRKIPATPPKKRPVTLVSFLGFFAIAWLLTFVGSIIGDSVSSLFELILGIEPTNLLEELADDLPVWAEILFLVILAPIFEEIFYRKLVYDRIRAFGELPAILLCGILFGLIHGNFYQFFYTASVGILFCYIYAKTGRILYTILLHIFLNFSGTVMIEWFNHLFADESSPLYTAGMIALLGLGLCLVASLALAIVVWVRERKPILFGPAEEQLENKQWAEALFTSPVTWIFLLVTILPFFSDLFVIFLQSL